MAGWVPIRLTWINGEPILDWCELGPVRLTAPFFAQSVHDAQTRSPAVRQTPADLLLDLPSTGPGAHPAGLIFHLSRCGSTLAAQALAALPENIVVSEPELVDDVLQAETMFPGMTRTRCVGWLRGLARAYGWQRFPEEERLICKLDAWHILYADVLQEAFPETPWVFMYRDPVEVLVSQLTEVSGRMLPGPMSAAFLGLPLLEAIQIVQEEFCARALGHIASAAVAAMRDAPLGRLINYSELPEALEIALAPWFGVPLSDATRKRMQEATRFHAKSPGRPFLADTTAKQHLATPEVRNLAQRWVGPAYHQLEALRQAQ